MIKDKDYAQALDKLGFCLTPLFTSEQIDSIRHLYNRYSVHDDVKELIASHSKMKPEKSLEVSNAIQSVVMPALEKWFTDFEFFIAGFMVKEAHTAREFPLHQDWNILDESQYNSYQIWIPLDLSFPHNGGIYVLPGSHRFFGNYRSGSYGMPMVDTDNMLRPLIVDMIIAPGQALVYHNSLFHASYPNDSGINRISAIVNIYTKKAPLYYWHKNAQDHCTDKYSINRETFLQNLNTFERGDVPQTLSYAERIEINPTENGSITSKGLVSEFNNYWGANAKNFEPRQLHIIKNTDIENEIQRNGYVVLDFLDKETVDALMKEYEKQFRTANTSIGRFTPMEHTSPASKRQIHDFIIEAIKPALDNIFKDYQTPIASYFTKYAHSKGDLSWHNDASIMLNTHLEPHYGIWCPLVDVDENNGAFCLIESSHKFGHAVFLRGLAWPYQRYSSRWEEIKKVITLKAGQIVLFDLRLIHDAVPNESNEDRVVFCVRLTHQKSKYYSFLAEENDVVSVFEEYSDYYLRDDWSGENQAANRTKKVGEMQHIYSRINYLAIDKALNADAYHISS